MSEAKQESILTKNIVPLVQAMRKLGVNPSTGHRWASRGVMIKSGQRIYLEVLRLGGIMFVEEIALQKFVDAQNPPREDVVPPQTKKSKSTGNRSLKNAELAGRELEKLGA